MLSIKGASKAFAGVTVVDRVSFDVRPGEIHALLGANGAGKSTLINILGGRFVDSEGSITLSGRTLKLDSPAAALSQGIAIVHQDFDLVPELTVAENVFLGRESQDGKKRAAMLGPIRRRRLYELARTHLERHGLEIDPTARVCDLPVAARQLTQIARALALDGKVVVFDEPTARLGPADRKLLFAIFDRLKAAGRMLIFVTHYLDEVMQVSDRATVMRDGKWVDTVETAQSSVADLSRMMVGEDIVPRENRRVHAAGSAVLDLVGHRGEGFEPIDLRVGRGEIVGLLGHPGSGRHEVTRNVVQHLRRAKGRVKVGFLPEDRRAEGIFPHLSVGDNIALGSLVGRNLLSLRPRAAEREAASRVIERLRVRTRGPGQQIVELSGGNQQKAVFGRATIQTPDLYVIECPTVGVDVRAAVELEGLILDLAKDGAGVLLATDDLDEAIRLSDRILVMFRGRISSEFKGEAATRRTLVAAMGAA